MKNPRCKPSNGHQRSEPSKMINGTKKVKPVIASFISRKTSRASKINIRPESHTNTDRPHESQNTQGNEIHPKKVEIQNQKSNRTEIELQVKIQNSKRQGKIKKFSSGIDNV
jgi:hypothetical protein